MDFFEQQHRARRHTGLMVVMFLIAVAGIVLSINVVGGYIYIYALDRPVFPVGRALAGVPRSAYVITTLVVLGIIAFGTFRRMHQLSGGGAAVAEMIDARPVKRGTTEASERRLMNIVEEMALASGIAAPRVFVMDDQRAINAFAAGYSPNEATIIVTSGALEALNRDELQGVVAHEFSHILNGDMRLNVHLIGVLAGIVLIGSLGAVLMTGRSERGNEDVRARVDFRLFLLGLALWLIGSVGVFAARLIKAVISREREFLADASAVQFTRNPGGIGGALFKIGERGSALAQRHAEELSHMCIGAPVNDYFEFTWFHDHPPLEVRMERLLGPAAKRLLKERIERAETAATAAEGSPVVDAFASPLYAKVQPAPAAQSIATAGIAAEALVRSVGNPSLAHVDHARSLLDAIPADIRTATQSETGAEVALFALLIGGDETRERQLSLVRGNSGADLAVECARFADALGPLGSRVRLPLLGLVLPTLKTLAQDKRDGVLQLVRALIEADHKVTLGEFVLLTICGRQLGGGPKGPAAVKHRNIDSAIAEASTVLSLLVHAGGGGMAAFDKGMSMLGARGGVLSARTELHFEAVERSLSELNLLAPLKKPLFIKACVAVAMADDKLTVAEGELLQAICAALDTPLPPILETTEVVA